FVTFPRRARSTHRTHRTRSRIHTGTPERRARYARCLHAFEQNLAGRPCLTGTATFPPHCSQVMPPAYSTCYEKSSVTCTHARQPNSHRHDYAPVAATHE